MKTPNAETLILFAFLGCIALWAVSKCSAKRSGFVRQEIEQALDDDKDDVVAPQQPAITDAPMKPTPIPTATAPKPETPVTMPEPTQYNSTLRQPTNQAARPSSTAENTAKPPATKAGATLFVTIDGLNVRKEPGLKGETLEKLPLFSPVTFLNQKTEWTQEISLGYEKVTDHWIKIRTATGKTGWVFGAGLHYYKMKRSGVMGNNAAEKAPKKKN